MTTNTNKKTEIEQVISEGMTLRKFYNFVVRLMNKNGVTLFFGWDDFKRWNGQIHDYTKNEFGTNKFITEWDESNACYIFYQDIPNA